MVVTLGAFVNAMELDVTEQDVRDGVAMRRLRDALPDDWLATVGFWGADGRVTINIERTDRLLHVTAEQGATIAEAADKCRAAIDDASGGMA